MADVFISYARADEKYAEKIANILKGWDFTVWWDRSILPGEDFRKKIKGQLETAKCAVVLWSMSAASESEWVCDEARMAKDGGIYVPACLDEPINVPLGFQGRQYADLQDWQMNPSHPGITDLLKAIEESVKRHTPPPYPHLQNRIRFLCIILFELICIISIIAIQSVCMSEQLG